MPTKLCKTILAVSVALVALLACAIPVAAQPSHYNLRMENNTGYDVYRLYFSSVYTNQWGDDILGSRVFRDGTTFTITGIAPGRYDLKFVDEDQDVCVLRHVFIDASLNWDLSQSWLLNCEISA